MNGMIALLAIVLLAIVLLAGCVVAPAPPGPPVYGYGPGYYYGYPGPYYAYPVYGFRGVWGPRYYHGAYRGRGYGYHGHR